MVWTAIDRRWEEIFALLVQYKAREGHCRVLFLHQEESITLGTRVGTQREAKRQGKIGSMRRRRLEGLGLQMTIQQ